MLQTQTRSQLQSLQSQISSIETEIRTLLQTTMQERTNTCITPDCNVLFDFQKTSGTIVAASLKAVLYRDGLLFKMGEDDFGKVYTNEIESSEVADILDTIIRQGEFVEITDSLSHVMHAGRGIFQSTLLSQFSDYTHFFPYVNSELSALESSENSMQLTRDEVLLLYAPFDGLYSIAHFIGIDFIMCKEYGDDDDWCGVSPDEYELLQEDSTYQNFSYWY